jgi:putative Ca2+/H+ antiporter (TMEM165/GDT1 family)
MLAAFTVGLLLITISELGDKTFCIAMLLAMRHARRWVLPGVVAALAAMTILSVLVGQVVSLFPKTYIHQAEIVLFIGFGLKLLYDAYRMSNIPSCDELENAEAAIACAGLPASQMTTSKPKFQYGIVLQVFTLIFVAEWGDRTQFATIALAASNNPWGVTLGAILGHTICAAIAVVCDRLVAGRLSERLITAIGGLLPILFGLVAAITGH